MEIKNYCPYCKLHCGTLHDIKKHLLTMKHKNNSNNDVDINNYINPIYKCFKCDTIYKNRSSFNKHNKAKHTVKESTPTKINCKDTDKINDEQGSLAYDIAITLGKDKMMCYLNQIKDRETKLKEKETEIKKIYEVENEFHKKVVETSGQLIGRSMNMMNYAIKHFKETPKLLALEGASAKELLKYESNDGKITRKIENNELPERIAKLNELSLLPKHIGNNIVTHYKKSDPSQQSLWVSDVSRTKFIVRDDEWKKDDNGIKINKNIITPVLEEVLHVMSEYRRDHHDKIGHMTPAEEAKYVDITKQSHDIYDNVRKGKIGKDILKHMTPYFSMDRKN